MTYRKTYIIDFFNIFSDYRETYYKKLGVNFHTVKYKNLIEDTRNFFDLFFDDYITVTNIDINSDFIFVMKCIYNYTPELVSVLDKYRYLSIKFVIVKDRYKNTLVEQNKDDFICQYLLSVYRNSVLISNDKYKNKRDYTELFMDLHRINIQIVQYYNNTLIDSPTFYIADPEIICKINSIDFERTSLSKDKWAFSDHTRTQGV